jgi:L-asparaginase II
MSQPVLAEIVRSGVVEGHHYGAVVALRPDGSVDWAVGDVDRPVLPRSCSKPLQALGMLRLGLDLPSDLLALAAASHSAEQFHLEGVRRILGGAGLDDSALRTPADLPLDPLERDAVIRSGGAASPILMNCSGKHAAMLATCVLNGWDLETYRDVEHPLQRSIAATCAELTGESGTAAVDGCGAPVISASLTALARAFGRVAVGVDGADARDEGAARVARAIREHPAYVSGTRRDELRLLRAVPGAIAKFGAEACYAVALADGRAFAVKIDDGGDRARPVLMTAALVRAGVDREPGVDGEALRALGSAPLLGGGSPVGEIRACLPS